MLIEWKPEYSVCIARFDDDHHQMVSTINQLHTAMLHRQGTAQTKTILERLSCYTQSHFEAEETLMRRYNYPDFADHKVEHDSFRLRVSEISSDYESGRQAVSVEVMDLLQDWLATHIRKCDQAYVPFFRSVGVVKS